VANCRAARSAFVLAAIFSTLAVIAPSSAVAVDSGPTSRPLPSWLYDLYMHDYS